MILGGRDREQAIGVVGAMIPLRTPLASSSQAHYYKVGEIVDALEALPPQATDFKLVHPLIQCARGALTDEDYVECERLLAEAVGIAKDLEGAVSGPQATVTDEPVRAAAEAMVGALDRGRFSSDSDTAWVKVQEAADDLRAALAVSDPATTEDGET